MKDTTPRHALDWLCLFGRVGGLIQVLAALVALADAAAKHAA
jgi:hypothetical protein